MNRPGAAGLLAVLLVASAVLPVGTAFAGTQAGHPSVSGSGTDSAPASQAGSSSLATQEDFDQTEFQIHVFENGSARWTFRYMKNLNSTNEQEFRDYADEFNSNDTQLYLDFQDRSRDLTDQGENVTGRDMDATGFSKEAYVEQISGRRGVVEMSFVWTNFAATPNDRILVGDVFEGGLYLGTNQALTISHGSETQFYDVQPDPDSTSDPGGVSSSESVTYRGEREFDRNRPYVELGPPQNGGNGTDTSDSPGGPPVDDGFGALTLVALFVVLLLGLGAVYAYRSGALGGSNGGASGSNPGESGDGGGTAMPPPEPAISDEELLSDEDRVLKLLEERGGRMKQVKIVDETGWSKSKVSMLLSDMEDAGDVSKLRVGRENIVSLAGHEPDAARSPFDDEE